MSVSMLEPVGSAEDGEPPEGLPIGEVEDELCCLAGQIAAAQGRFLELLAEFDVREGWAGDGILSCAHWLSWRCSMTLKTAREHLRIARALTKLPRLMAMLKAGRLSFSKVRALTRVATPATEEELMHLALSCTAEQLEAAVRAIRHRDVDDELRDPQEAERDDRLHWKWDDEGRLVVWGRLTPEDGAAFLTALQATANARAQIAASATRDEASAEASADGGGASAEASGEPCADGPEVVDLLRDATSGSWSSPLVGEMGQAASAALADDRGPEAPAAEVVVHVDADPLTGLKAESEAADGQLVRAHLEDGPALTLAVIERLACDGRIRLTTHGSDGRTLDLGRRRRSPNAAQVAALRRRDQGCAFPGCGRRRFLHAHHVTHWAHGGPTSLDNLVLLCGGHHRLLHNGGYGIQALGNQRFRYLRTDGGTIDPAPTTTGSESDLGARYAAIRPDDIVPTWYGDRLELDRVIDTYARQQGAEGRPGSMAA